MEIPHSSKFNSSQVNYPKWSDKEEYHNHNISSSNLDSLLNINSSNPSLLNISSSNLDLSNISSLSNPNLNINNNLNNQLIN
jgi:hypothetical protein